LAVGASCTISVEFKPASAGSLSASLSIADNAAGTPQTVALTGTGAAAATTNVTLTPASIAFPTTVTASTSVAQVVTVKNTGAAAATISSIALGGTNATSFVEIGTCGTSLAAGASCSIYLAFKPASAGALTGKLSVTDNATGSPQAVTLTGTGTAAPTLKLSATSLAFPTTIHATTSAAQTVTLTNAGPATITLASITLAGTNPADFVELKTCGSTLAPAATCQVIVAFKPAAAAAYTATLSIADNGASSPQSVALSGTGK
jgi:P pilus assembly chaperone PapD